MAQKPAARLVSVNVKDANLATIFIDIFNQARVLYKLRNLPAAKINANMKAVPLDMALRSICASAVPSTGRNLSYTVKNGVYIVDGDAHSQKRSKSKAPGR